VNAPTALLNRFQKILFTFDGFLSYLMKEIQIDDKIHNKIVRCQKTCVDLVKSCGRELFSGYSPLSTVASIMMASLRDDGKFMCPRPYEKLFSVSEEVPDEANETNALEMLMLIAQPKIIHMSAFDLDESLKRAYLNNQKHHSVVDFIVHLNNRHCHDICWNVFTEKDMISMSRCINNLRAALRRELPEPSQIIIVSLTSESRNSFIGSFEREEGEEERFIICLADMSVCTGNNVNFAKRVLEEKKLKWKRTFVIFVQLFPKNQLNEMSDYCTALFNPWRCTFVETLYDGAKRKTGKSSKNEDCCPFTDTFLCFIDVIKRFGDLKHTISHDLLYLYKKVLDEKGKKSLREWNCEELEKMILLKEESCDGSIHSLKYVIERFAERQIDYDKTLDDFLEDLDVQLDNEVNDLFKKWTMGELFCLLLYWCQTYVHEEDVLMKSRSFLSHATLRDGTIVPVAEELRKIVEEFQSIMEGGCLTDDYLRTCLSKAQGCCRIREEIDWSFVFSEGEDKELEKTLEAEGTLEFNKCLREPCRCCMKGFEKYRLFIARVCPTDNWSQKRRDISDKLSSIASAIFMRPYFYFLLK